MTGREAPPLLIVVADRDYVGDDDRWLRIVRDVARAATGEPVAIQVRAKQASPGEFRALAARARDVVPSSVPLLLNGDAALAATLGYDGVHWAEANIPPSPQGRALRWRSAAVHSLDAVRAAERAGAHLLVFGAVFEPQSKPGAAAGIHALREVVTATALPVIAIGGVTATRARACLEAGARGVAVVSGVLAASSPAQAVAAYLATLTLAATSTPHQVPVKGARP